MSQDITERKLAEKTLFDRATRDALLIAAAQRLLSCAGAGDLVGRLAGDEFVIIATTLSSTEAAENLGEQLCRALAEPFTFNGHTGIRIGASVGIAFSQPSEPLTPEAVLAKADHAMYEAKRKGRSHYRFAI